MSSDSDYQSSTSFFGSEASKPPSLHEDFLAPDCAPDPAINVQRESSQDMHQPCSYHFVLDTFLAQTASTYDARRRSTATCPIVEDDEEDEVDDEVRACQASHPARIAAVDVELEVDALGVPVLKQADLGEPGEEVGRGGDRGARVYRVQPDRLSRRTAALLTLLQRGNAHKVYQSTVSADEASFTSVAGAAQLGVAAASRMGVAGHAPSRALREGLKHLVIPAAFVINDNRERKGLLVPLYDGSLAQLLMQQASRHKEERSTPHGLNSRRSLGTLLPTESTSAFLSQQRYPPIESPAVILAIGFQLLSAVATLNDELPHEICTETGGRATCTGYSHNDIYIDNVLLSKRDGRVALCDFELVGHLPRNPPRLDMSRFPPPSRTSPLGFFSRTADSWSFALFLIGLMTGVDPLFSNAPLTDDFGDGPLLLPFNSDNRDPNIPVLDWEENIKGHVHSLLDGLHLSDEARHELEPIMAICKHCLANNARARPLSGSELIKLPVFSKFRASEGLAEAVVREWASQY